MSQRLCPHLIGGSKLKLHDIDLVLLFLEAGSGISSIRPEKRLKTINFFLQLRDFCPEFCLG